MYTSGAPGMIGDWDREREAEKIPSAENHGQLGKEEFLRLLITQLENQDPLNPMDDKEFVAQLAQFSSLEQLTNISEEVKAIKENSVQQDMVGAVGFIGKEVMAEGDQVSKDANTISTLYYNMDDTAAKMYFNIFDSHGNMVRTVEMQARQAGEYEFNWDGKDYSGREVPDGNYKVTIGAEGFNGEPVMVNTSVSGRVSGVQSMNGQSYLRLADGRVINFAQVSEVVESRSAESQKEE